MPFAIQPVTVTDAPALASVMTDSRWADHHWKALFKPSTTPSQVTHECAQRLPWNLINGRAAKRHEKAVDVETGQVVGYARWLLPAHLAEETKEGVAVWQDAQVAEPSAEQRARFERDFVDNTDDGQIRHLRLDLLEYRNTALVDVDEKYEKDGPYLCKHCSFVRLMHIDRLTLHLQALDYLSTAPAYQRRGIGALMLQSGLRVADAHGLKTIVTASPAGLKLYLNHGFELLETVSVDYSKYGGTENTDNHFMVRQPLSAQ